MNQLTEMLICLAECRLSVSEWIEWWDTNQIGLEAALSRADYIRLKPKFREGSQATIGQISTLHWRKLGRLSKTDAVYGF